VDFKMPVVIDEAEVAKFVHEMAYARPGRSNHFGERLLADLGDDRLGRKLPAVPAGCEGDVCYWHLADISIVVVNGQLDMAIIGRNVR